MQIEELIKDNKKYVMNTYGRFPIALVDGYDAVVVDSEGKTYVDFLSGIGVNNLGYSNRVVKQAMINQVNSLIHTSNLFQVPHQITLAQLLCENSFGDKAFFCNSGAEANEAAIKIARKRAFEKYGEQKNEIVAASGSFHGRTLMTLSLTDSEDYRKGYGPHPKGFVHSKFNNIEDLQAKVNDQTAAIIIEPIQGEGGVNPAELAFIQAARQLADDFDCALIFDEIQCGMGRTGKLFAYEHYGVAPDLMTLAKGLANGVPIGAVVANTKYGNVLTPGSHGTTFGGNPLATAAGVATMTEINQLDMLERVNETGAYFYQKLLDLQNECSKILEVRGKGLMLGIELKENGGHIVKEMLNEGYIINCTHDKVLRFLPPFVIENEQIDSMVASLKELLSK